MTDTALTIGAIDCNDGVNTWLMSLKLGAPSRQAEEYGGPLADLPEFGPTWSSAAVESRFVVKIAGASGQAVQARVAAIAAELRDLAPIVVTMPGGLPGTLVPKLTECVEIPLEEGGEKRLLNAHWTAVEIGVLREPYVRGAPETLYGGEAVDLPAVVQLADILGSAASPLNLEMTAPSADLQCFWAGLYPDPAAVVTDFVFEMHDKTWTGGSAGMDATGWPDGVSFTLWQQGSNVFTSTSIDTAALLPGEYLVLARCKTSDTTPHTVYAGASAVEAEMLSTPIQGTTLKWYPLGVVALPARAVKAGTASPLYVAIKGDGADVVSINCVALVPTSWGMVGWRDPASHCDELSYEAGTLYVDGVCDLSKAIGDRELRALGGVAVIVGGSST